MIADEYLNRSRIFRRLKNGPHGSCVELYASRLVKIGLSRHGTWRSLNMLGDLTSWLTRASARCRPSSMSVWSSSTLGIDPGSGRYKPGDRAALRRLLSVLRETGTIAPAMRPPLTPHEQIFEAFSQYLQEERGLATKSIVHHLPFIRLFLREVCPGGASDHPR